MKIGFYPKLAWDGVRKNKRFFFPYILTGCVMVMMYYILRFLKESPAIKSMKGASSLMFILPLGCAIILIFSMVFLFYTNSFIIKQRYREFGLYNILGMDKKNICKIMGFECLYTALASIIIGLFFGILFSKAAELILFNLLGLEINFTLRVSVSSVVETSLIYTFIYFLLLLFSLIKVRFSKPLDLMQSSKVGERVPKKTWILAVLGILLLGGAYYLAVSINEPLSALLLFFVAVIMVIIGTYLIFISGSVVFCRLLQKNKKYYYKPNHFVSVSSMVYRMKRNGAGLASICILLTMVLVMISSSASLYFGAEDSLNAGYPNDINIYASFYNKEGINEENLESLRDIIKKYSGSDKDLSGVRAAQIPGLVTKKGITIDYANAKDNVSIYSTSNVGYLYIFSLEDYNKLTGQTKTLSDDECLLYCDHIKNNWDTFTMEYGKTYHVKEKVKSFVHDRNAFTSILPTVYAVVNDINKFVEPVAHIKRDDDPSMPLVTYRWQCGFDTDNPENSKRFVTEIDMDMAKASMSSADESNIYTTNVTSRQSQKEDFYDMYGSLLFLGIMLSIVFLMAAVLIIYYKQICEGYEDYERFEIMQKVGMTKKNIKKSINSQMLTVFFMPLIFAGIHLAFAFPFVMKIFKLFAFNDTVLAIIINLICFAAFGVFYAFVYKITSGTYYKIVSGRKNF